MLPHTQAALEIRILQDIRIGQSSAQAIADHLRSDLRTVDLILQSLLTDGLAQTHYVAQTILVYQITDQGLALIS